ncbi:predicted protein [Uncinocarpus reesii 1704]|uniref:CCHC-type domain-containing protein n=1 Tax=Uncinocarpus reesii (strain UAMH 1704) TaxID=336963 RepID=C4JRR7_UNCRE|nr:uncharacterized protein UREG_05156 [Uncinocarpus reesii 1704]EEP80314.1 predicted protein [Uncinocarpus reesii 1704]
MPGHAQGDDSADDSRTAAVGPRNKRNLHRVTKPSSQPARGRRSLRDRRPRGDDLQDFIPRGAAFTSASLPVDVGSNSNSDQSSDESGCDYSPSAMDDASAQPQSNSTMQPAVNWNKVTGSTIRTSLRASGGPSAPAQDSFDSVNGKYWRSESTPVSENGGPQPDAIAQNGGAGNQADTAIVISEDSDIESDAAADNSIMLNLSTPSQHLTEEKPNSLQALAVQTNGSREIPQQGTNQQPSAREDLGPHGQGITDKSVAIESFNSKYPSPPHTLVDLSREDRDIQIKYIYYNRDPKGVDLNLPIGCTDCLAEGHLAEICPDKECKHCGAWSVHESRFCPSWRRCQRCRERGHDEVDCPSLLKELASEIPCDFCNSNQHIESECDLLWKVPKRDLSLSQIFISVCCSFCTSKQHLLGDCPVRPFPMNSSSWSLSAFDPSLVSNIASSKLPAHPGGDDRDEQLSGLRIKGRANEQIYSDDDHDDFTGRRRPLRRQPPRSHIRFDSGIGRGRNLDDDSTRQNGSAVDRYTPHDYRREYRDREPDTGRNVRQRSLSPGPYNQRQRGGGGSGRHGPPRSPPRGRGGRAPPPSRGGTKNKRGGPSSRGGRGAKSSDNRETYRPMPSAAKRAWDKHRL